MPRRPAPGVLFRSAGSPYGHLLHTVFKCPNSVLTSPLEIRWYRVERLSQMPHLAHFSDTSELEYRAPLSVRIHSVQLCLKIMSSWMNLAMVAPILLVTAWTSAHFVK